MKIKQLKFEQAPYTLDTFLGFCEDIHFCTIFKLRNSGYWVIQSSGAFTITDLTTVLNKYHDKSLITAKVKAQELFELYVKQFIEE